MTLIADDTLFQIAGHKVLVSHGDLYCTDDKSYQRFRKIIRHPIILKALLSLSKKRRIAIAEKLRQNSKDKFQKYPVSIDVNLSTVEKAFVETQADIIIHGHTHIADIHAHDIKDRMKSRMVLGDWHDYGWFGQCDASGVTLNKFPIKDTSS
jgi:UDP-2,3-diacylglucosamine hydrolase